MPMDLDFHDRRVLVTAGTKGIGKAVVGLLKQQGATVLATARHMPTESIADAFVAADLTTMFVKTVKEDFDVWSNRHFIEHPRLIAGEGNMAVYRRWTTQFYPNGDT